MKLQERTKMTIRALRQWAVETFDGTSDAADALADDLESGRVALKDRGTETELEECRRKVALYHQEWMACETRIEELEAQLHAE